MPTYSHYKIAHIFTITFIFLDSKRVRKEPYSLKEFFLTTSTSAVNEILDDSVETYWKNHIYFVILDAGIIDFKNAFLMSFYWLQLLIIFS